MRPFNLELAKAGHPVCTRDGRDVRILCFDTAGDFPITALIMNNDVEVPIVYKNNGSNSFYGDETNLSLKMKSQKKSVWKNFYMNEFGTIKCGLSYSTELEAINHAGKSIDLNSSKYLCTQLIEWEE